MKIKKDIFHVIFFVVFFGLISISLLTLVFLLGFEITKNSILIYLLIIIGIIFLGIIIFCFYFLFCKTYYEFTNDSIRIVKKENLIKEISYKDIKYCEYYGFIDLLFGDPKGGRLMVYYLEGDVEKNIEISFSKNLIKKIIIKNIYIK